MNGKRPIATLRGGNLGLAAIAIGLASFTAVMDITIANVSVPTISGNLGVGSEEGEWAITSFAIANAICIPLTGWLGRRFGQVRLFIGAVASFTLASSASGLQTAIRMMSGSLIASLAQTFWNNRSRFHSTHLVERLNPYDERTAGVIALLRSADLSDDQAWSVIARAQDLQARMLALNDFLYFSSFAFIAALAILWFAHAPHRA
ncbi:MFS transporter [Methylocapsa palsarum]|uniref:Major Facilitator Superfamily protein n=1 Tax=Methylocapsa palsarum TaxID=1612308 RepID=A0A1I3YVV7_9HYPH|nr:MFS transporter [Methylocapsa palsarum]SFK35920.1 Major Facilitator Superfamily protein [Methylocapsa palsarum]